ncbi:hypothetical protein [Spiroplasma poulsonii]|nr:hypothetical protein [Spiroplasma poulsonii]UNF62634.1 hypothetical protein MNU24_04080 [Spiroplasma poulsonii]
MIIFNDKIIIIDATEASQHLKRQNNLILVKNLQSKHKLSDKRPRYF